MTYKFISKRAGQMSAAAMKIRDHASGFNYELSRQSPYNEGFAEMSESLATAMVDLQEAVARLDSIKRSAEYYIEDGKQ